MPSPAIPSPDDITLDEFRAQLARYPAVLQAVSDAKGSKPGQTPLADLDAFRYETAPGRFAKTATAASGDGDRDAMTLDDVKMLVSWKLRHGKFRPTLMRLVESNDPDTVRTTVKDAVNEYRAALAAPDPDTRTPAAGLALRVLCCLRGIGPATASLLLAVHDPAHVVFFGDEVYAWLCGGAGVWARPKKYNDREYADLRAAADALQTRLGDNVQAVDIEKVAYVLLAGDKEGAAAAPAKTKTARGARRAKDTATTPRATAPRTKRKRPADDDRDDAVPLKWTERVRRLL